MMSGTASFSASRPDRPDSPVTLHSIRMPPSSQQTPLPPLLKDKAAGEQSDTGKGKGGAGEFDEGGEDGGRLEGVGIEGGDVVEEEDGPLPLLAALPAPLAPLLALHHPPAHQLRQLAHRLRVDHQRGAPGQIEALVSEAWLRKEGKPLEEKLNGGPGIGVLFELLQLLQLLKQLFLELRSQIQLCQVAETNVGLPL